MRLSDLVEIDDTLREYQKESKQKIYSAWNSSSSVLFQMPTGTGKTRLFSSIIKDTQRLAVNDKKRYGVLVLAHRKELIEQISDTLGKKYHIAHGIIQASHPEETTFPVQVASVQTISNRIDRWKEKPFSFIIIDEAHHALAKTYKNICSVFPDAFILGVTATPCRLGGAGLREVFGTLVLSQPIKDFIEQKWLSKYSYYSIAPESEIQNDIDSIEDFALDGDYSERAMIRVCDKEKVRAKIIDAYEQYAKGKKGIVYTINQVHNEHICEEYQKIGVNVKSIDSKTPASERKAIVSDFRKGNIQVICNVNIFSEGFDCPDIEFIQLARPTKSLSMYLQQVGRGLRPHHNKELAIIIDNVGSYNRFGLPSANRKWHKHFEGYGVEGQSPIKKKPVSNRKRQYNFNEGDDEMLLIYDGAEATTDFESPENAVIEEFLHFPVGYESRLKKEFFDFIDTSKFREHFVPDVFNDYDEWISEVDTSILNYCFDDDTDLDSLHIPLYRAKINGKYGIYDGGEMYKDKFVRSITPETIANDFTVLLEPVYDEISIPDSNGRMICKRDGKFGVINGNNMCIILPCVYDKLTLLHFDKYIACKNGKYGIVGADGPIVPFEHDRIRLSNTDINKVIVSIVDGDTESLCIWDNDNNKLGHALLIKCVGKCENRYIGKVGNKGFVFIRKDGKLIMPILFSKIAHTAPEKNLPPYYVEKGESHFFMDENLRIVSERHMGTLGKEFLKKGTIFSTDQTSQEKVIIANNSTSTKPVNSTAQDLSTAASMISAGGKSKHIDKKWQIIDYKNQSYLFMDGKLFLRKPAISHITKSVFSICENNGKWKLIMWNGGLSPSDLSFNNLSKALYDRIDWEAKTKKALLIKNGHSTEVVNLGKY